jgi:hypothetical protein
MYKNLKPSRTFWPHKSANAFKTLAKSHINQEFYPHPIPFDPKCEPIALLHLDNFYCMIRQVFIPFFLILVFGIPFLLITDLFPLHRYGMFARIPVSAPESPVKILEYKDGNWTELSSGSPYLDAGILPRKSLEAFGDTLQESQFRLALLSTFKKVPDSIALEKIESNTKIRRILYP